MVEVALFNINDVALIFGGLLSMLLALLLIFRQPVGRIPRQYWIFLAFFFFLSTLHTLDTLFYWSINLKVYLSSVSTNFFFILGFVFFLQGPLLYWFTKATIVREFVLNKKALLHFIPVLIYPFYIYFIYHQFDNDYKLQYVLDWSKLIANPYFEGLIWAQRLIIFLYSLMCLHTLYQYIRHPKEIHYSLNKVDLQWLKLLLLGFCCINTWVVLTLLQSLIVNLGFDRLMVGIESYLRFIYMGVLVVYLLQNSKSFSPAHIETTAIVVKAPVLEEPPIEPQQQLVEKLQAFMQTNKPYLEPHITVERLATKLQVSPKLLSGTINSQLHMNFFEMIGTYRIEEAKKKLADAQCRELPISEIMKNCGFSSKSVFNQAFKRSVGVTPSHYRQQYLN